MKIKPKSPIVPPAKIPSPHRERTPKPSEATKPKPTSKPITSPQFKLQMLDSVEILRDQKDGKLRKGMRATILDVYTDGPEKDFIVEVIRPSIVETVGENDVRPIED